MKELDQDDEKYLAMLNEAPVLEWQDPDAFEKFLCEIIDRDYASAFRRPVSMYTKANDAMIRRHQFFEKRIYKPAKMVKNQLTRLGNGTFLTGKRTK